METIHVNSASELLDELRPSAERWRRSIAVPMNRPLWLYRGQMDSEWDLVPSLFRQNSILPPLAEQPNTEPLQTRYREFNLIKIFQSIADREGILPSGFDLSSSQTSSGLPWWLDPSIEIPIDAINLYALAQHHGISTRLLDWTTSPLSAAFFAASNNWRSSLDPNSETPDNFAIWAFVHHGSRQLKIVSPRYSDNQYMRSQRGRFTIDPIADINYQRENNWISHNALIQEDESSDDGTIGTNREMLIKLVAPSSIAQDVLITLRYEGVDQASLMPSLDTIAKCAQDEVYLHNLETLPT